MAKENLCFGINKKKDLFKINLKKKPINTFKQIN